MRTFQRVQKQVDQRVKHSRRRGNIHTLAHDLLVYALELKTFHVKQLSRVPEQVLTETEKELLAAGESLEERTKQWLAGQ